MRNPDKLAKRLPRLLGSCVYSLFLVPGNYGVFKDLFNDPLPMQLDWINGFPAAQDPSTLTWQGRYLNDQEPSKNKY